MARRQMSESGTEPHAGATRRRKFVIYFNPAAGRNKIDLVCKVADELRRRGASVDLLIASPHQPSKDLHTFVDNADAVIVAGGDGTFRYLATELVDSGLPLGLIPCGTGNVLAAEFDLPRNPKALAEIFLNGPVQSLEGGLINNRPFFLMCGVGFDGGVVSRLKQGTKHRFGKLAYLWPLLATLASELQRFDIVIDGYTVQASWILVSNAMKYAGNFTLLPGFKITDPGFIAIVSTATTRWQRFRELLAFSSGKLFTCRSIKVGPCSNFSISDGFAIPAQADGDGLPSTPINFSSRGPNVSIIVPDTAPAIFADRNDQRCRNS